MKFTDADNFLMRRALTLAEKAKGTTFPNPAVGALVVSASGEIIGEGATGVYGGPHAEKQALKKAGERAQGAAMYVTLEPCAHFGKTPPCADEIIKAGIIKVIAAVKDPNPLVRGKGFRKLKRHGIDVEVGLFEKEATAINEDFFWSIINKRPWITLKLAMTLDGKIADSQGGSKWITSEAARREVQEIRRRHGAIAVGKNTLICDNPKLTARCGNKTYYPARIVFCSDINGIPKDSHLFTHAVSGRTIMVTKNKHSDDQPIERIDNIELWRTGAVNNGEHIETFLEMAYDEGINSILIEGGQQLASNFLEYGYVNKLHLFYGNKIFGAGKNGLQFLHGLSVENGIPLYNISHKSFGDNFLISGYTKNSIYSSTD